MSLQQLIEEYGERSALSMGYVECLKFYAAFERALVDVDFNEKKKHYAYAGRNDLFFLLTQIIGRDDMLHPWIYARCREVQAEPNGCLDLWAREHYKSTIITFGLTIQDILNNPEGTFCIFSHTRPQAKGFLRQIKQEFEGNVNLKMYYPDVLWDSPKTNAPKWSEDDGLIVRRKGNPKEPTLSAYGLIDGMPTGMHFGTRIYDDVVVQGSVTTPEMIQKVDYSLALSVDLGTEDGVERFVGTRYAAYDSYRGLIDKGVLKQRIHPACPYSVADDGKSIEIDFDKAVLRPPTWLKEKYVKQGSYVFGCQQLQNPQSDQTQTFSLKWVRLWDAQDEGTAGLNVCIIVDPASGKRSNSKNNGNDYTSMWVLGRSATDDWYIIDGIRDRLNLSGRCDALMELHQTYRPFKVFYEEYGMQADIEHIKYVQRKMKYEFDITPLGGSMPKHNRIARLMPVFEAGRVYLPKSVVRHDIERRAYNVIKVFLEEEYASFPVLKHDDMLDCLARIEDEEVRRLLPIPQVAPKITSSVAKALSRRTKYKDRPVV